VTVAKITKCNGHLATLAALSKINHSVRERLCWLIIGEHGEADYVDELNAAIAESKCDVRLMGELPPQQIRDIYGAGDLFCLVVTLSEFAPFESRESVYIEAAAAGLPSVAAVSSAANIVTDNETGRLVEPAADAIADAIVELIMDGIKRVSLGKRAWMYARALNRNQNDTDVPISAEKDRNLVRARQNAYGSSGIGVPK
jgi:endo-1,4-beta-xylanase/phosphatidylinositol alpha-1,6-mannosyltransferase